MTNLAESWNEQQIKQIEVTDLEEEILEQQMTDGNYSGKRYSQILATSRPSTMIGPAGGRSRRDSEVTLARMLPF